MKPEDWQAYQTRRFGEAPQPAPGGASNTTPPPYAVTSRTGRGGRLSWPWVILILGLTAIAGCYQSIASLAGSMDAPFKEASQPSVGVLVMENEIFGSIWATEALNKFAKDDNIKSVVIRINSPGGAVAPCQEIYKAVKALKKPVVVSMGSVAASGGLYVAAAGDVIMANPGTITGSIGVIMQSVEVSGTMEKIGLSAQTIKSGEFKDIGSPFRGMRDNERQLLQKMVSEVYEQFLADLTAGRSKMDPAELRRLADGRIYNGAEAHQLGLVDELGGFEDALLRAAQLGHLPTPDQRPELIIEDGRKPWWESVMQSRLGSGLDISLPPALTPGFSLKYIYQPDFIN
ncbi:MAG: signal peptide peptidase SppA [Candidatus Adiutrix sp.]|jgi:protease-4|nr:signal peptide peptidase SppA [Candidatus Adiutrix sp.]